MRKALSMLGAIAAIAVGSLFALPSSALAYTVNCTAVPSSNTSYPWLTGGTNSRVYRCGTAAQLATNKPSTSNGSGMSGTIYDLNGAGGPGNDMYNKLKDLLPHEIDKLDPSNPDGPYTFPSPGVTFLLFPDVATYTTYYTERNLEFLVVPTSEPYLTAATLRFFSDTQVVNVFEKGSTGIAINKYYGLNWATAHEAGHAVDKAYAGLGDDPGLFSESAVFDGLLKADVDALNLLTDCGTGGLFNGRTGYDYPNEGTFDWICAGTAHAGPGRTSRYQNPAPPASPLTNFEVLMKATGGNFRDKEEIWANLVARSAGLATSNAQWGLSGYFMGGKFKCSLKLVGTVINTGLLPLKSAMPTGCPTSGWSTTGIYWELPTTY